MAKKKKKKEIKYYQYHHAGACVRPCIPCLSRDKCIYYYKNLPPVGEHPKCDCTLKAVDEKQIGTISNKGLDSPDVVLKLTGKLPNYYITKEDAEQKYGWNPRRNTLAGKAPGKMIGNVIYKNRDYKLPSKPGRIWYECDVDYISGSRSNKRMFYSNDGLIFYSDDHGQSNFYLVDDSSEN